MLVALVLCLGLPACASAPDVGEAVSVELLDEWFVQADGERMSRDEFVFRMRMRCRTGKAKGELPPRVVIHWRDGAAVDRVGRDLMEQLLLAGVRQASYGG